MFHIVVILLPVPVVFLEPLTTLLITPVLAAVLLVGLVRAIRQFYIAALAVRVPAQRL